MLGPAKSRHLSEPIAVSLEGLVLRNNVYRHLEAKLDLGFVCDWTRELYADRARADMAATFAHELAHAVTHDAFAGMPRDVREVVAESVAYAVCSRFGLDLSLRSVDDIAGWGHPQGHDPEAFRVSMAAIHDGAAPLIDAIEMQMTKAGELKFAA